MAVLVTYATALGSSREIAQRIASRMAATLDGVECRPVEEVESLSGYEAVVLGSAIHNQAWLPAGMEFFTRHAADLATRPVWIFSVGMADALPKPFRKRGAALQQGRLTGAMPPDVPLRGHETFSGVFEEGRMSAPLRVLFRLAGGRFGDLRDWAAIEAWADGIAADLSKPTPSSSSGSAAA